jgi:hypothetical protein
LILFSDRAFYSSLQFAEAATISACTINRCGAGLLELNG